MGIKNINGWLVADVGSDIDAYYRWFVQKEFGIELLKPTSKPHISIIRGEVPSFRDRLYENEVIEFEFGQDIYTSVEIQQTKKNKNTIHFFLKAKHNDRLQGIRAHYGLQTYYNSSCHLTIGKLELDKQPDILTNKLIRSKL
jgi:hypothetical protein